MREIKFRMWDIARKSWSIEANIYTSDGGMVIGGVADNGLVFQEFTGLKDKNDKEIYEGDIVKTDNYNGIHYFVVEFRIGCGGSISSFDFLCIDGEYSSVHCEATHGYAEVIGNIYENPDLIADKEEKDG